MTTATPRMNPAILRLLEEWTTHQDYFWFLAVLAWGAYLAAEVRRKPTGAGPLSRWLGVFAAFQIIGAGIELVLLAQDIPVPYTKLDLAMGAAQAGGTAALWWGVLAEARRSLVPWFATALLAAAAAARYQWPTEAGLTLALAHAVVVLLLVRRGTATIRGWTAVLLSVQPIVATHGPWAHAIDHGRRMTDWSHFALPAAALMIIPGAVMAVFAWRRRLEEVVPAGSAGAPLRRDLRRALMVLIAWLSGGVALAFWYGRHAQRAFEADFLRRVELSAYALDPALVASALDRELRIVAIETQFDRQGRKVAVGTLPDAAGPAFAELRNRVRELQTRNPDFTLLGLRLLRDDWVVMFGTSRRREGNPHITQVLAKPTPETVALLREGAPHVQGPIPNFVDETVFEARVPLFHPTTRKLLGWLVGAVYGTRWSVTFVQARLQTMALVAAGVGLWTVTVAYRLRREARDAAEQRAAAAAEADRLKSAFLAKVSHELRTPIQSVLGYSELLASAALGEPHRTWLGALRTHGDVMLRLVNDLIDLGALQSGAFRLEPTPIKLRRVIDECAAALRPGAASKHLTFEVEIGADVPAWVRGDGVRLRQVLLNLLANAVKFTPAGRVSLRVQRRAPEAIEFVVADTGPGIPLSQRSRLFQPFARLDPTHGGGTGLGLALVQGICTAMGGSVQLVNEPPGATFVVQCRLPECEPEPDPACSPSNPPSRMAGMTILVAEDNSLVRELLVAFLAGAGAEVSVASNGVAALALAREFPPHVLLLDIGLPGMDGISVAEKLRAEGVNTRIIGLSAHATADDEMRARDAGMEEFLTKPVSLERLAHAITREAGQAAPSASPDRLDRALRARLVAQFARETPQVLAAMGAALSAGDHDEFRRLAHYLKNSADVLGLHALQSACHRVSGEADIGNFQHGRTLLEAIEAAIPPQLLISADANSSDFT